MTAKRVRSTGREPTTRQTRKAGAPRTSEEIARAATTDPFGLDGVRVNSPLTLALGRHVVERLSARAKAGIWTRWWRRPWKRL